MVLKPEENTEVGAEISVLKLASTWDTFTSLLTVAILSSPFMKSLLPDPSVHVLLVDLTPPPAQDWNTWLRSSWSVHHIVLSMIKELLSESEVPISFCLLLHRKLKSWSPGNHWQPPYVHVGLHKEINTKDIELRNIYYILSCSVLSGSQRRHGL